MAQVIHVVETLDSGAGGVSAAVVAIDKCLNEEDIQSEVYALNGTVHDHSSQSMGKQGSRMGHARRSLAPIRLLLQIAGGPRGGPSVLHIHGCWGIGLWLAGFLGMVRGWKVVWSPHGMLDAWSLSQSQTKKRLVLKLGLKRLIGSSHLILCTARSEAQQVRSAIGSCRTSVVGLPIFPPADALINARRRGHADAFRCLYLGRIHPKKGLHIIIEALSKINIAEVTLRVVGALDSNYAQSCIALASELGVSDRVEFCGAKYGETRWEEMADADLFVIATRQENYGLAIVEALMAGTRAVITPGVDIWQELLESGSVTIADHDASSIASAIYGIVKGGRPSDEQRLELRRWACDYSSPPRSAHQLRHAYEELF